MIGTLVTVCSAQAPPAVPGPDAAVIPIRIDSRIDASRVKVDEPIIAKTLQDASINGHLVKRDSKLLGHVVAARGFTFDPTPYATQQPSVLALHFDTVMGVSGPVGVTAWVRAFADHSAALGASGARYYDEYDRIGLVVQIGGDRYRPADVLVYSPDDDIVAYHRDNGVFARLLAGEYRGRFSHFQCEATPNEVSVAMFSASACGLYGFHNAYLVDNGRGQLPGTFQLESRRQTVVVDRGSVALLQLIQ